MILVNGLRMVGFGLAILNSSHSEEQKRGVVSTKPLFYGVITCNRVNPKQKEFLYYQLLLG